MRILHIIHSVNPAHGGTTTAIKSLVSSCEAAGHFSPVITLDAPDSSWLKDWTTSVAAAGPALTHFGWTPNLEQLLYHEIALCDLVVVHGLWQYHGMAAHKVCRDLNKPYLVYPHGMLDPWALRQTWIKRLRKAIIWLFTTKYLLKDASRLCFTCEEEHASALPALKHLKTLPAILALGVEDIPDEITKLKNEGEAQYSGLYPKRVLLFLGRLHPKKGCDILLEGFANWTKKNGADSGIHLRMAGPPSSGEYLEHLHKLCGKLDLIVDADVSFPGMLTGRAKWQALASADALILPSFQENFGIVVGEALACKVPVLLSNRVNIWRWITEAGAGFVAHPSVSGVEILLDQWFTQNQENDARMRHQARQLYESRFSQKKTTRKFLELCSLVCGGKLYDL